MSITGAQWNRIAERMRSAWKHKVDEGMLGLLREDLVKHDVSTDETNAAIDKHRAVDGDWPPTIEHILAYSARAREERRNNDWEKFKGDNECDVCKGRGLIITIGAKFKNGRAINSDHCRGKWMWRCPCRFGDSHADSILELTPDRREQLLSADIGHIFQSDDLNVLYGVIDAPTAVASSDRDGVDPDPDDDDDSGFPF